MKKKSVYDFLSEFLISNNVKILSFNYYKKIFVNIVLLIEYNNIRYEFITDRGEIFMNKKLICNNSYMKKGKNSTVDKLIQILQDNVLRA